MPKTLTEQIKALFDKWEWLVTSYGWKFNVIYYGSAQDFPRHVDEDAAGQVFSDWSRLTATIHVNLEALTDISSEQREEFVVHELTHMLLDPLNVGHAGVDALEYTTTTISRIFLGMFKENPCTT